MKNTKQLLAIVEDIFPNINSSEKLFIVGLIIDEQSAAYKEASEKSLEILKGLQNQMVEDERDERDEDERLTAEDIKYEIASQRKGELI